MDAFTTFIDIISNKKTNNIPLDECEIIIINMYKDYVMDFILTKNGNDTIVIKDIMEMVKINLIKDNKYIIKLNFTNGKYMYLSLNTLLNIEYFKMMFDNYNFGNNCIINLDVCKEIDNYEHMTLVLKFVNTKKIDKCNIEFEQFYTFLCMVDFLGPTINNKNIVNYFLNKTTVRCKTIYMYELEHIYTILKNNNVKGIKRNIFDLWKYVVDKDDVNIFKMSFFCDIMTMDSNCKQMIITNKQIQLYSHIIENSNHESILSNLLKINNDESWKVIMNILSDNKKRNHIDKYFANHKEDIPETIFDYNISKFYIDTQLDMLIKYNKIEFVNIIGDNVIKTTNTTKFKRFYKYINTIEPGIGNKLKKLKGISPINKYLSTTNKFPQMLSYYPLEYRMWKSITTVDEYYKENDVKKGIITHIEYDGDVININLQTQLLINDENGEDYNIATISKILYQYYDGQEEKYVEINEINCNSKNKKGKYCLILNPESLNKNIIDANIHI